MPAKKDRCVKDVVKEKVDRYKKKHNKEPSEKLKKKYEESAYAICTNVLGTEGGG